MNKTLVIYGTKYRSTKEIAEKLARILGPAAVVQASGFSEKYRNFDSVLIGSPLYGEMILPEVKSFITDHIDWLKSRKIALFAVSLSPISPKKYFSDIIEQLGDSVVWVEAFGGIMNPAALDQIDHAALRKFSIAAGIEPIYHDARNDIYLAEKAVELKRLLKNTRNMPADKLIKHIEDFLLAHNTCVLCTGHGDMVRATPIEYGYIDGKFYFLSEGGEKFSHLLFNPYISIAVYDNYQGFNEINGLQITGKAEIIPFESSEYNSIASIKGLDSQKLSKLPVPLNMFKVIPTYFEFLCSKIGREGYDIKQTIAL